MFNVLEFRKEFPILSKKVNSKPLVYLDNGASSQKPVSVIDTVKIAMKMSIQMFIRGCIFIKPRN